MMKRKAFTLVELIVVITILAILGTIAFISLSGYSKEARDAKRVTDTSSLLSKINIEETRGTPLSDLITNTENTYLQILGNSGSLVKIFGKANFKTLKEDEKNFRDPSNKNQNYPLAYAIGGTGKDAYKFIQIATISEKENKAVIKGNYYRSEDKNDAKSLFLTGGTTQEDGKELENGGETLPYPPKEGGDTGGGNYSCIGDVSENVNELFNTDNLTKNTPYQNTDLNGKCYYNCKKNYISIGEGKLCNVWIDPSTGYKWEANPTGRKDWAINTSYTEPKWDEITKRYDYDSLGRTEEDYPAFEYCTDLGYGWKLPTKIELESLAHKDLTTSVKTNHPGILLNNYWSSTSVNIAYLANNAWSVNFANATTYDNSKSLPFSIVCIYD